LPIPTIASRTGSMHILQTVSFVPTRLGVSRRDQTKAFPEPGDVPSPPDVMAG
jgi:hypothetical protein